MNRIERELKARPIINGRSWTTYRRPGGMEVSELHNGTYFPNHWDGKSELGRAVKLIEKAGSWRRQAHAQRSLSFARNRCIEMARGNLERARRITVPNDDDLHASLPHLREAAE